MRARLEQHRKQIVEYDSMRHRVWILGQRCHHGATGSVVATIAFLAMLSEPAGIRATPTDVRPLIALAAAGGVLMVHDWKDRQVWFERGHGDQP
jgi:hypothetical protein